ncbi:hypothetical protein BHE74_00010676 [Ensete ventricosum]|nr:hypothetical protein GW17_00003518 [Ensete ventricosum]RWW80962.1 hypothetical protein BHE74_00010676 [Ensete ventricosum]
MRRGPSYFLCEARRIGPGARHLSSSSRGAMRQWASRESVKSEEGVRLKKIGYDGSRNGHQEFDYGFWGSQPILGREALSLGIGRSGLKWIFLRREHVESECLGRQLRLTGGPTMEYTG